MRLAVLLMLGSAVLGLASPTLERRNEPVRKGRSSVPAVPDYRQNPKAYEERFVAHENDVLQLNLDESEYVMFKRCVEGEVCSCSEQKTDNHIVDDQATSGISSTVG